MKPGNSSDINRVYVKRLWLLGGLVLSLPREQTCFSPMSHSSSFKDRSKEEEVQARLEAPRQGCGLSA